MTPSLDQDIRSWAAALFEELGLDLYDVEHVGGVLRIVVDRDGGVGLDEIARFTRGLSPILDERDPIKSQYTLEVSSPGLERRLRTPRHWQGVVGSSVKVKLRHGAAAERRLTGTVVSVGDGLATIRTDDGEDRPVPFDDVESARTVYEWQATPKPGSEAARKAKAVKDSSAPVARPAPSTSPKKKAAS